MSSPDPDFIRYAKFGEEAAFCRLVTTHLPMVLAVAGRRLGDHAHLASDVAQAAFTRLAKTARGLPPNVIPAAWLHRQTVRLAIDAVRSETRRRLRERASVIMLNVPDSPSAPSAWEDLAPLLDEALDRLPEADRTALVLRYFQEKDLDAVGAALGSTPDAARKRIARGLEKLRLLLGRRGITASSAAIAALLLKNPPPAAAAPLAVSISQNAFLAAGAGSKTAVLITFAMSHFTAVSIGASAALLAAACLYQHQEAMFQNRAAAVGAKDMTAVAETPPALRLNPPGGGMPGESGTLTLSEIIASLREIASGPDHRLAKLRTAALLRKIPPEQYSEFYLTAEALIPKPRWPGLVSQSIAVWQDRDAAALTKALFESDNRKREVIMAGNINGSLRLNSLSLEHGREGGVSASFPLLYVFEHWLKLDYPAAVQWMDSESDSLLMKTPIFGRDKFLDQMAEKALTFAPSNSPLRETGVLKTDTAWRGRSRSWAKGQLEAGAPWTEFLTRSWTPEETRALVSETARRRPEEVRNWILTLDANSGQRFEAALGMVGAASLDDDNGSSRTLDGPQRLERARFALEQADGRPREEAFQAIVSSWMQGAADDPEALRTWILEAGSSEETVAALSSGARFLANQGIWPEQAAAFAAAIPDPARRDPLLRGIFLRWSDTAPQEAGKFLAAAPPEIGAVIQPLTTSVQP